MDSPKGFGLCCPPTAHPPLLQIMSERFLPSLGQLKTAAEELPDPEIWPEDEYVVPLEGKQTVHQILFNRVKFSSRSNGRTYRWIYHGKVMIRTGSQSRSSGGGR